MADIDGVIGLDFLRGLELTINFKTFNIKVMHSDWFDLAILARGRT